MLTVYMQLCDLNDKIHLNELITKYNYAQIT